MNSIILSLKMIELKKLSGNFSIKINMKKRSIIESEVWLIRKEERLLPRNKISIGILEVLRKKRED